MSRKSDLSMLVDILINELNETVSRNSSLNDEQVIELSHRIDDLVISINNEN